MAKIKVLTIGCRLNQAEGERLAKILEASYCGSERIFVINTCAVTKSAVRKSLKLIRRIQKQKRVDEKILVTGCLTEAPESIALPQLSITILTQKEKAKLISEYVGAFDSLLFERSRPLIKLADGCINECTFCLAHVIRGSLCSFVPEKIIREIEMLSRQGYKEVVLTALNLGAYGRDLGISLVSLLNTMPDFDVRIRLSSIEPDMISEEFLRLFKVKRLCQHLHVPIQSGDDEVLKAMGRKYRVTDIKRIFDSITKYLPDANLGTDIIIGFPNESEQAFLRTVKLLQELPINYIHIFPYSPRRGTIAYKLGDPISSQVKKERIQILNELNFKKRHDYRKRFIGKKLEVIVESKNWAISDNYLRVKICDIEPKIGELKEIVLTN